MDSILTWANEKYAANWRLAGRIAPGQQQRAARSVQDRYPVTVVGYRAFYLKVTVTCDR
jgi:hypothetical protein